MRKIHELMIQDVIWSHENLYKSKANCGYLTDKDTVYCNFRKEFIFTCRYRGEDREIHVVQLLKVAENTSPYNSKYTYANYQLTAQIGFLRHVFSGEKAIKALKALLTGTRVKFGEK